MVMFYGYACWKTMKTGLDDFPNELSFMARRFDSPLMSHKLFSRSHGSLMAIPSLPVPRHPVQAQGFRLPGGKILGEDMEGFTTASPGKWRKFNMSSSQKNGNHAFSGSR